MHGESRPVPTIQISLKIFQHREPDIANEFGKVGMSTQGLAKGIKGLVLIRQKLFRLFLLHKEFTSSLDCGFSSGVGASLKKSCATCELTPRKKDFGCTSPPRRRERRGCAEKIRSMRSEPESGRGSRQSPDRDRGFAHETRAFPRPYSTNRCCVALQIFIISNRLRLRVARLYLSPARLRHSVSA